MEADWPLTARMDTSALHMEVDGDLTATCGGCMAMPLSSPFSPAQPWARQDAPFSQVSMARRSLWRSVRTKSGMDQVCGAKQRHRHAAYPTLEQQVPSTPVTVSGVRVHRAKETDSARRFLLQCRPVDRERDVERRPLPFSAFHRNRPSMRIHHVFHNLRPESRAPDFSADRLVREETVADFR